MERDPHGNGFPDDRVRGLRLMVIPAPMRRRLRRQALSVIGQTEPSPDYDTPPGDPGLFGPDSVTWRIHSDFPSMMAGGLAALMLQALHPLALAGVWDHSSFREDTLGRLRNTTAFIARTTYAPRASAEAAIAHVRRIHRAVTGTAADGRPYSAEDPHLLTWVHCAECFCFLQAYQAYRRRVPGVLQDRYLAEVALIAEALGARDVPKSRAELDTFFMDVRPELVCDERTREVLRVLAAVPLNIPWARPSRALFLGAGAALLPDWASRLTGRSAAERLRDRLAAGLLKIIAPSLREAMARDGIARRACVRVGVTDDVLEAWPDRTTA